MDRRKFIRATGAATVAAMIPGRKSRGEEKIIKTDLLIIGSGFAEHRGSELHLEDN